MSKLPKYVSEVIGKVNVDTKAFEESAKEAINKENDKCPECNGSGKYQEGTMRVCNSCHGSGIKNQHMYEIWCMVKDHHYDYEGVNLLGSVEAESFKSACDKFFIANVLYNSDDLTYKCCKLYETQIDALNGEDLTNLNK